MIMLMSLSPRFCPNCGKERPTGQNTTDFFAGTAHTCKCGLHFAYAKGADLLELASKTGDMGRYVTPYDVAS